MKVEISKPLVATILGIYEKAEWIEGLTMERPRDQLTRLVDALVPRMQDAEWEERIEREILEDAWGAFGDAYYDLEDEDRADAGLSPYEERAGEVEEQDPGPPVPADDEQMPF